MFTYDVAGREVAYGVLSGQGHGAEHDEDQDEVGEDLVVDQFVAEHTEPGAECETVPVKSVSMFGGTSAIVLPCFDDSRVGAAEEEEGASCWDGGNLLFDGEFRQPLGARSWWDFWKVLIILLLLIGHCNRIVVGFFFFLDLFM